MVGRGSAPDRVAVPGLAVDVLALVPVNGVIADQGNDTVGSKCWRRRAGEHPRAAPDPGAREDALVIGGLSRREVPEGADEVRDRAPSGGENGRDEEG